MDAFACGVTKFIPTLKRIDIVSRQKDYCFTEIALLIHKDGSAIESNILCSQGNAVDLHWWGWKCGTIDWFRDWDIRPASDVSEGKERISEHEGDTDADDADIEDPFAASSRSH